MEVIDGYKLKLGSEKELNSIPNNLTNKFNFL
jgi:hypothetical protein